MSIRILLVDDHEVVRRGLSGLLSCIPDYQVVGEADGATNAVTKALYLRPDVTRVIMLTSYNDEQALLASVMAGPPPTY